MLASRAPWRASTSLGRGSVEAHRRQGAAQPQRQEGQPPLHEAVARPPPRPLDQHQPFGPGRRRAEEGVLPFAVHGVVIGAQLGDAPQRAPQTRAPCWAARARQRHVGDEAGEIAIGLRRRRPGARQRDIGRQPDLQHQAVEPGPRDQRAEARGQEAARQVLRNRRPSSFRCAAVRVCHATCLASCCGWRPAARR